DVHDGMLKREITDLAAKRVDLGRAVLALGLAEQSDANRLEPDPAILEDLELLGGQNEAANRDLDLDRPLDFGTILTEGRLEFLACSRFPSIWRRFGRLRAFVRM